MLSRIANNYNKKLVVVRIRDKKTVNNMEDV